MACVTLKRPLEWQDPSMSPEHGHGHMGSGGSPGGSPTSMIISNSPPHHSGGGGGVGAGGSCSSSYSSPFSPMGGVPNKRACLGSGIVHSTSSSSPFRATEQIRDEMLRLKMVRDRFVAANHSLQQQKNASSHSSATLSSPVKRPSTSSSSVATSVSSPSASSSSSSSSAVVVPVEQARNNTSSQQQQQQPSATLLSVREIFLKAAAQSRTAGHHHHHHHPNQQPVFSLDEVVPIVERLLAEQEEHLRLLLQERLAEQYDQFRRFTADQLLVQAKARAMEQANQEGGGGGSSLVSYLS